LMENKVILEKTIELRSKNNTIHYEIKSQINALKNGAIKGAFVIDGKHFSNRHIPDKEKIVILSGENKIDVDDISTKLKKHDIEVFISLNFIDWCAVGGPIVTADKYVMQPFVKYMFEKVTATNQFIVVDDATSKAAIIDSVLDFDKETLTVSYDNAEKLLEFIVKEKLDVEYILDTHMHADHLTASQYLKYRLNKLNSNSTKPIIAIGEKITKVQSILKERYQIEDMNTDGRAFDKLLKPTDSLHVGSISFTVLETPGHTPEGLTLVIGNCAFAGDSIFLPDVGSARCDFPGGDAVCLYSSITSTLFNLPSETLCYVGHDYPPQGRSENCVTSIEIQKKIRINM